MEQEVARWLSAQLGYNVAADGTLSANCRGNLRGLWEFLIANYKTAESKRHIQHVLARRRQEQEEARQAPEKQRQALAQRQRLQHLRKRAADLEQTLSSLQVCTGGVRRDEKLGVQWCRLGVQCVSAQQTGDLWESVCGMF